MKFKSFPRSLRSSVAAVAVSLVFASSASAAHQYKVLHNFLAKPANAPFDSLVADAAGNLYGVATNYQSPTCGSPRHCGAVFKLTRESGGIWKYSILHVFKGRDGDTPYGTLVFDSVGNLYGTTFQGGAHNLGTVFELSPKGNTWTETVLYSFGASSNDLQLPWAGVTFDANGNLYGTAGSGGGKTYSGGVFELKPSGNGWQESVLYSFNGYDGSVPKSNVVFDSAGNLYSTTAGGGNLYGVVFELTPSSDGHWTETILYTFDGGPLSQPTSGVIFDAAGNLYGTTAGCGNCNPGAVYELSMSKGTWSITILHAFTGSGDGGIPFGGVIFDSTGNLYGTTALGGKNGFGTAFRLSQSGGQWTESILHSFNDKDGNEPSGGLILNQGVLYGTTFKGGAAGYGVVFSIVP